MAEAPKQPEKATQFELQQIIERCVRECEQNGSIKDNQIVNLGIFSSHVSKTIIGELYEFEILRKIGPMFRQFTNLQNDFNFMDEKTNEEFRRLARRTS